jgi:hypothetical protein
MPKAPKKVAPVPEHVLKKRKAQDAIAAARAANWNFESSISSRTRRHPRSSVRTVTSSESRSTRKRLPPTTGSTSLRPQNFERDLVTVKVTVKKRRLSAKTNQQP